MPARDIPRHEARLISVLNSPVVVFVISLAVLWVSVFVGAFLGHKVREQEDSDREDLGLITNSSLTLLALIIGFTFSMALGRYDQRRNYEEEEANAIGTEYVRAELLPQADAARIQSLLAKYLDQRLLFYRVRDLDQLKSIEKQTTSLETEMWSTVRAAATDTPTPTVALAVSGMNDVLNRTGYTQAAWLYRVPIGAWSTMISLSIGCCVLIGFGARRKRLLLGTLPVLIAISFFFIADIDSPRDGIIRVVPQNLISLSKSLHSE